MRHKAFTLAELLIALAILGVIATFTIPKVLQGNQDAKKKAIFKEDVATLQQITWGLVQDGSIQLRSHSCATTSPIDARIFVPYLNYTRLTNNTSANVAGNFANGSRFSISVGNILDLNINWDGSGVGTDTYGDDVVMFNFNDCTGTFGTTLLGAGKFGTISSSPAGYIAENQTLWDWIWKN